MRLNTYPYNPFPASTDKLDEAHNAELQHEVNQLKNELNGDPVTYPYTDVITIEDAVPSNLAGCTVKIEPVQSGSGDPSPTNIRPITGHTQAIVTVADDAENPTVSKTYTIALGDTIYGGTVDFDSGVMTVDRASQKLSSLTWTSATGNYARFSTSTLVGIIKGSNTEKVIISELYKSEANTTVPSNQNHIYANSEGQVKVWDNDYTSDQISEWLSARGDYLVCYELATPTTIQLTPQQIQLLKGTNTLTASTGDISVTVNGVSGSIGSVQTQANATDAALAELAEQLPDAPTTDGAYVLTVTVDGGTPTYSWESAE